MFLKDYLNKGIFKVNLGMTGSLPSMFWVIKDMVLQERMSRTWGQSDGSEYACDCVKGHVF